MLTNGTMGTPYLYASFTKPVRPYRSTRLRSRKLRRQSSSPPGKHSMRAPDCSTRSAFSRLAGMSPTIARRTCSGSTAEYSRSYAPCRPHTLPDQGSDRHTDVALGREEQDPGVGHERTSLHHLRHRERQSARADIPQPNYVHPS